MAKVMREVPAHEALGIRARERGYKSAAAVKRALEQPPYNIDVGRGYLAGIFNGDRPWPGDELFAALLHLLDLNLEDLGMDPSERPVVWLAVRQARTHGWPQPGPPDDGVANHPADGQVNEPIRRQSSLAGHGLLVGSGFTATAAA
jgi:hypothetical protein